MNKKLTIIAIAVMIGSLLVSSMPNYTKSATVLATGSEATSEQSAQQTTEQEGEADGSVEQPASAEEETTAETPVSVDAERQAQSLSEGMEAVAENEHLILYVNQATTEVAVQDKRNGAIWYSNPQDREDDAIATGYNKSKLNVQLELTYYDSAGNSLKYDNYTHSIQNNQFVIEKTDGGLNIVYTLGEVKSDIEAIPKFISEERFQTLILGKIASDADKKEIEKRFRFNEETKQYERRDSSLKGVGLSKVTGIFKEIGYDEEQIAIDKAAYGEEGGGSASVVIPLHYRLDGEYLRVSIPEGELQYPDTMKIQTLSLLPFFGASGLQDEGYSLVPDGSGSLIHFNNEKTYAAPYRTVMYGADTAINQLMQIQKEESARLPVFGMNYGDRGFLGIIEKGDAVAAVEADVSGRLNQYNTVYSSFTLNNMEEVTLTNGWRSSTVKKFQAQSFHGEIAVAYGFLGADEASYSGMAAHYRDYLTEQNNMARLEETENVPFYVELIGGIPKKKFFLGIPYNAYQPLTTFEQAQDILDQMKGLGIEGIQLRYTGWFNDGVNHNLPKSVSVDKKLGGSKGLTALQAYADNSAIGLYPDATFLEVYADAKGFKKSQASRLITNKLAAIYPYRISTFRQDDEAVPGYVLSPNALPGIVDGFLKDYTKLGVSGLSLRDIGDKLNSDYNRADVIDREEAKGIVLQQLQQMSDSVPNLMVEGGNAYSAPYARHIVDAPMTNSGFNITDESVPFLQLVYHGYIQYAGTSWNMADDQDSEISFLKALETGSALHYTWFYADPSAIKMTDFDDLYSADYRRWIDEAAQQHAKLNNVLQDVQDQVIKEHKQLATGVYQTTFEKGKTIIVNYNEKAANVNGVTVDAKNYWVGGDVKQ
ncbi:DUF5696 domain-containing protein [Paenibacillus sp. CAU 1782]